MRLVGTIVRGPLRRGRRAVCGAALLLTTALCGSGCATTLNFMDGPVLYGGTMIDAVGVVGTGVPLPLRAAALVDLPASLVADTATAPIVLPVWLAEKR